MMSHKDLKQNTLIGLIWKFSENFGTQFINFVIQVVLARILLPQDYGIIALTAVFIMIAQVFIQTGFSSAIIQKKEVSDLELSTVFHGGIIFSIVLYAIIFLFAPMIANFYETPILSLVLRIQSITILISALSSIQNALLVRHLDFKKTFIYRMIAVIFQGIVGIYMALNGYGVWAIVISGLVNSAIVAIAFWFIVKWRPKLIFSFHVFKELFSYSSRILMFNLVNVLFNNLQALIIGKRFNTETLGYYNRGYQIPMLIMVNTDGAINSVMFSSLSKVQDDDTRFLAIYKRSIKSSIFIVFPMMIGLIALAEPLTLLILTDKWLQSVPFMQLTALICMTWPFSLLYQALNAQKKSQLSFRLNSLAKLITLICFLIALPFGIYAFVFGGFIGSFISVFVGFYTVKKIYEYPIFKQILDVLPALLISVVMGGLVFYVGELFNMLILKLAIQLLTGVIIYSLLSYLLNRTTFLDLIHSFLELFQKKINV